MHSPARAPLYRFIAKLRPFYITAHPIEPLTHSTYVHGRLPEPDSLPPESEPSKQRHAQQTSRQNSHHRRPVHFHCVRPSNRHHSGRGHPGIGRLGIGYRSSQPPFTFSTHPYTRQQSGKRKKTHTRSRRNSQRRGRRHGRRRGRDHPHGRVGRDRRRFRSRRG